MDVEVAARIIAPNRFLAFVRDISERKKVQDELLRSRESLRQLAHYIENVREEERLHTAKEIHDQLGQQLAVLKMDVLHMSKKMGATDDISPEINELLETINGMIETVRKIASDLRPGILDDIGLIATMDWFCRDFTKRTNIATTFISDLNEDKLPQKLSITVFRILQESLINIAKHSQATRSDVSLLYRHHRLIVIIEDNGKGFDIASLDPEKSPGIEAMKERALTVQGTYTINSQPGRGTIVELIIPLDQL
jgi:signal transduction histidine kinase